MRNAIFMAYYEGVIEGLNDKKEAIFVDSSLTKTDNETYILAVKKALSMIPSDYVLARIEMLAL